MLSPRCPPLHHKAEKYAEATEGTKDSKICGGKGRREQLAGADGAVSVRHYRRDPSQRVFAEQREEIVGQKATVILKGTAVLLGGVGLHKRQRE